VRVRLKFRNWATTTLMTLSVMIAWEGCEKSPVSNGNNPAPVPITSDVKWQVIFSDPRAKFGFRPTLAFDSSGTFGFAIGDQQSYFRTTDGGGSWLVIPPDGGGWDLFITSKSVAYRFYPFQRTDDAGKSWHTISTPTTFGTIMPVTENLFYFFAFDTVNGTSHRTTSWKTENGGNSWTQLGTPAGATFGLATADGINLVVSVQGSPVSLLSTLFYSNDGGTTWTKGNIDTTGSGTGYRYYWTQFLSTKTAMCVATWSTPTPQTLVGIFRTTDGGANWNKVYQTALPYTSGGGAVFFLLARSPRLLVQVIINPARSNYFTYNSDDDGLTWTATGNWFGGSQPYSYYTPTFAPPDWRIGISGPWMTQDGGKTWTQKSWYVANAAFLSPYEVIGVRDTVILRGTAR